MDTPLGSVLYITLGCAKNEVDTDRMRSLLTAAGYEEAFDPQDADIAIVNTCSFLASATSESIETTLELANEVQDGVRSCPIVMCGCVPSRYGDDLPDELPEVAAFVKADEEDGIVAVIDGVLGVEREIAAYIPQVKRTVEGAVAYVKISDGCNRFCSFCMIPYIRGRYHSRNAESIISEVRDLVAGGVREIVLIGQDTGIWGTDFADEDVADGSPRNLAQLLRAVAEAVRPHNVWVRVLYLQPEGMTDELIETIRDTPEVLPYIDIPVQHCDARILKAMRRSGSRQELEDLFRDLRERIPGIVIRSTAMVGFPTETDDEFRDLIDFMDTVGFDYTSVFAYSREEGSLAAKMEGQVDEEVKLERAQEAMDLGFDGLIVESHCTPDEAWSDKQQQVTPDVLCFMLHTLVVRETTLTTEPLAELRQQIDRLDDELLALMAKRMRISREIGQYKKEHSMPILQAKRYDEILNKRGAQAVELGINPEFVKTLLQAIHEESVHEQVKVING